tara:strand:+ start:4843 stop:5796 length:954 start_codon:yes stop_codon:yes gene_type:complete
MAAFAAGNAITTTTAANYIPEMWSDEIIGSFKANLVLANLVTKIMHNGKKGDTVHIPNGTRGAASAKSSGNNAVTLIVATEGKTDISINKHFEYSRLIEDIVGVQAIDSYRKFYTDDAGFALAKKVDTNLHELFEGLQGATADGSSYTAGVIGSDGTTAFNDAANTNTGNGTAIADAGLRKVIQTLDDADVPLSERYLVIAPVEKKNLMGLSRFTEQAFVGEGGPANTIRNGHIGDVYGVPVYVSTNVVNFNADDGSTAYRANCLFHRSAFGYVEQMGVRSQTQYMQEYLSDLFTADTIYGVGELRNDAGVCIISPA